MRRTLIVVTALAFVVVVTTAAVWWQVSGRMLRELADWQRARAADGLYVQVGPVERTGWPLRAELVLHAVTIATDTPGQTNAAAWQAGQVHLVWTPWRPWQVDALVVGEQTVRFGAAAPITISADPLDIGIPLDAAGQAQGLSVRAQGLMLPFGAGPVRVGSLALRLRATDAFVSAEGAVLPGGSLPFGGTVQSVSFHARSTGPLPPLHDPAAALAAWRDAGQRLLVDELNLHWGPLGVQGHASVGLDAAMQPEGSAAVRMTGFAEVIDALARSGAISRNDARVATTLLGLMAQPAAGNVAEADLPLTLKDRTLSIGAIPVLRVRTLAVP